MVLIVVGLVHNFGRRELYGRAEAADATLDAAAAAASEQYAILARNIERREHERLLHDTVLNTLTALARDGADDPTRAVSRCRQDVALIEEALGDQDGLAAGASREPGDLADALLTVVADLRGRGLIVHVDIDGEEEPVVPARVTAAVANATREALSNVAAHAGTGEAWVQVLQTTSAGQAGAPGRVEVIVRDQGAGFDLARIDRTRLGLRRSIAERIADCGGQAAVWSTPGHGAVVRMSWPAAALPGRPDGETHRPDGSTADPGPAQESPPW
jgi:signal transduction histidine kinase